MARTVTWLRWLIGVSGVLLVATPGMAGPVTAIAAGTQHTCALTSGGGVVCWGWNSYGQLGDGTTTDRHTPVAVSGLSSGATAVAAGEGHACAVTSGGGVVCWGANGWGQLGVGTASAPRFTPVAVSGLSSGVTAVAAGSVHTCALTSGGSVSCWGANVYGLLGDGTGTQPLTPVAVRGLSSGVTAVAASAEHTCAMTSGGGVSCWGFNSSGRLGDGTTTDRPTPVAVRGLSSGATAVAAKGAYTCAVTSGGGVSCWGSNDFGQLGDGTTTERLTPVAVNFGQSLPSISSNPVSVSVAVGATATFSAAAAGTPVPTVQWQVSTNSGTTWTNLTNTAPYGGTATATLTVTSVTTSLTGSRYRAVATNSVGTATSNAATLTVTVPKQLDVKIVDALKLATPMDGIHCDPADVPTSPTRTGAVTDGVSSLLLVVKSDSALKFSLADTTGADGTLAACGGGSADSVPSKNSVVAAIYTPPTTFAALSDTQHRRTVTITATAVDDPSATATADVTLRRVPVLLVHGYISDSSMWDSGGWLQTFEDSGFTISTVNYKPANNVSFAFDARATTTLLGRIDDLRRSLNNIGIAAAQVDVVAHSMGGLVSRQLTLRNDYRSSSNGYAGSIRRLVTIGTPHLGSEIARLTINLRDVASSPSFGGAGLVGMAAGLATTFGLGYGALDDMLPGSAALKLLRTSTVRTHAIVGTSPAASATVSAIGKLFYILSGGQYSSAVGVYGGASDLAVGAISQAGGRSGSAIDVVTNIIHSSALNTVPLVDVKFSTDVGEPDSAEVRADAVRALKSGPEFFAPSIVPSSSVDPVTAATRVSSLPALQVASGARLKVTSPATDTHVVPGSTLSIGLAATAPVTLSNMIIVIQGVGIIDAPTSLPATVNVTLPASMPYGPLNVGILASNTAGELLGDSVTIVAVPSSAPTSIAASPAILNLSTAVPMAQLQVAATFAGSARRMPDVTALVVFSSADTTIAQVDAEGLVTGGRPGTTTVHATYAGWSVDVPVTMTATMTATMSVDHSTLNFGAVTTGAAFTSQTSAQTVRLTQTGAGPVTWTAASTTPWLVVAPTSGSGSATLTVSTQFASGLTASQTGSITLTFAGAGNTAGPITATLTSLNNGTTAGPTGSFDTPTDGTTGVTGSIAVTGWALDDVEVTGVRILRDPVAGEPAGTLVAIGTAVLVDGARPDVQASFPTSPRNTRAGWGYLMLTNFLPGLGNGTFKLTAIADGHSTVLGTKTITCTNSTATAPTGALDTPAQGGTVSGNVVNFGWVLSPSPRRADPPSGGTVKVVIDGAFITAVPSGWTSRADLTALFPAAQYPGIVNALGVASFDSTSLANGVHTISWLVTDNLGSPSGIGSRYFTVSNGSLVLDPTPDSVTRTGSLNTISWLPPSLARAASRAGGSLLGRHGFDLHAAYRPYRAGADGRITVQAEELDRIELQLGDAPGQPSFGYLRVAGGLAPLPIGSALNASTGEFTWAPGVGFVGTYDLVFGRWSDGEAVARQDVRIVLSPKGSNRVGPQTIIDLPAALGPARAGEAGSHATAQGTIVVGPSFVLAGWAADLGSTVDRGIDAVHVWAYPATGDDPIWIGAATYGGARPDVAAVYGGRFLETGYGLTVQGLAPGTYDLAVFAYSTVTGGFVPAKTVRVTVR